MLGELDNAKPRAVISAEDDEVLARRAWEWKSSPTIWHAADLLSSAFVVGKANDFKDAANFVIENQAAAPDSLIFLAEKILRTREAGEISEMEQFDKESLASRIHELRKRLESEPRNALQWAELSRMYALLGEREHALRSMTVAAGLGPDNRFIVRSAARLFLHEHEASRALRVIRNASGAKHDPWLLSAEIAVASASQSPSLLAKLGRLRNEDDTLSPFDRTELASALATMDLENGKHRKARQLFRKALTSPNENSLAQVEWANRQIGGLGIENASVNEVPRSFEASAQLSVVSGEWARAIAQGKKWLLDQGFSKEPAIFTSYVSSIIEDYSSAIDILRASLKVNPKDDRLLNNLAFALASDNRISEAVEVLRETDYENVTGSAAITLAATHGLVLFRSGVADEGRKYYQIAIERATQMGNRKYRTMANLYLAREELLAATAEASMCARKALSVASESKEQDVLLVADQVERLVENAATRKA